ncbi:Chloride channel core [Methylocella silvestris BL2]|uniref:Chloride channel core n=1 Tax=Methylocella silvestris (strain DSM 15510 / CIP 108128 / LMG 27833 / NCIMB 13906 / BL2) TaxID=395965 RepID=B8EK42_METSB|nr:chloride channel protein [Methylocella silvestris]ACK50582.1 Chloride channel core [Methylocella silvestris BL2]
MAEAARAEAKPAGRLSLSQRARALIRRNEISLIALGLVVGATAGLFATGILWASLFLHTHLFGHERISAIARLESPWQALVPAAGGLLLGISGLFIRRWRKERPVDPIEANALRGGQMSLADSAVIVGQTVISNGFGASVGLEAAYTQMGSGFASSVGSLLGLRRADLRTLVACGSAGAIAAAFAAPLTGAFYAFELILGAYTPFGLAPVGAAAIGGAVVSRLLGSAGDFVKMPDPAIVLHETDMALLLALGILCAAFGIAIMRGVGSVEALFRWSRLPQWLHPVIGGLIVGALVFVSPHVLSSGHGATIELFDDAAPAIGAVALAIGAKSIASAVSIGSGFRGGLFFASLYLGSLVGWLYAQIAALYMPQAPLDGLTSAIIGMVSLAVAIVGGPLTMSFLALETTRNFSLSVLILTVTTLVSVIVRRSFGYSFATWRLHLRGESIRSAQDVGWMRDLTVGRLMRPDVEIARSDMSIDEFIRLFPLGSAQWVVCVDPLGRYKGMVFVPDAYVLKAPDALKHKDLAALSRLPGQFLVAETNVKGAAQLFEQTEAEALAVVDNSADRRVIGLLTEAHLLRRYAEELDKARRELSGEPFAPPGG